MDGLANGCTCAADWLCEDGLSDHSLSPSSSFHNILLPTPPSHMQADNSAPVTIRTRKFITNRLLARRQFVLDILHPNRANVSKAELSERLASIYKTDKERVVTFGLRTAFGGGRSTGFGLIYDDEASQKKFEPKYRLIRVRVFLCLFEGLILKRASVFVVRPYGCTTKDQPQAA